MAVYAARVSLSRFHPMETPFFDSEQADLRGMVYLERLRAADASTEAMAIIAEIAGDEAIGENQLTSLVAIFGNGRYEARGTREALLAKLRAALNDGLSA